MAMDLQFARGMRNYVDLDKGVVHRKIFYDADIYQLEMEQIFARAWLFMAHASQIPNPGDFFLNFMGEDRVIVVRNNEGGVNVLINSCRHRGNAVCRADEGHATSFMCTYHGWTYDLKGALVGVPGFKEVYHEELDRENWGLINAAQVDEYKGFIFATMDPEAPSLSEYLGPAGKFGIDMLADRGEMTIFGGVEKYSMKANWKFPSDNTADFYHGLTHISTQMAGYSGQRANKLQGRSKPGENGKQRPGTAVIGEYGHICGMQFLPDNWQDVIKDEVAEQWRFDPEVQKRMGPLKSSGQGCMTNIFPNLFVPARAQQVAIRMPKGPQNCEIWYFSFYDKNESEAAQKEHRFVAGHTFGASGMLEQDDGENWDQSTRGQRGVISSRYPLNYQMNFGRGEIIVDEEGPTRINDFVNENYMLWQHRAWSEFMSAESWAELKETHSRPEGTL
ncbi:MAG: aromatic ring-hydroxylating dioxygenase subunit alpha [Dehalococcoidia bacterium]